MAAVPLWLDCDPGHDDALAMILAAHSSGVQLLGISTVAGNQTLPKTTTNACKILSLVGRAETLKVWAGAERPLLKLNRHDPEIHGESGLEGSSDLDGFEGDPKCLGEGKAVVQMAEALKKQPAPVEIVATGMLTNVAMFLRLYPELLPKVRGITLMGGAIGVGNRHPVAEFNILEDPEAASIVFSAPVRVTMVPLEVTHTALATPEVLAQVSALRSPFSRVIVDLINFFKETYKRVFDFDAPPLHDACAVAYVLRPDLFQTRHLRVDVVTGEHLCAGQTVVDIWRASKKPANVHVAEKMNVPEFWKLMIAALGEADKVSPINTPNKPPPRPTAADALNHNDETPAAKRARPDVQISSDPAGRPPAGKNTSSDPAGVPTAGRKRMRNESAVTFG